MRYALIGLVFAACTPVQSAATPIPTLPTAPPASIAATATAAPSPAAATSAAPRTNAFAAICGTIGDFVADSPQRSGSFTLNATGRAPLQITIPAGRLGGQAAGYVCVGVKAGAPYPLFDGFFPHDTRGFVDQGTVPATAAFPAPDGFSVPQLCAYVAPPVVGADQTDWWIDCGAANNGNVRGTLGPALIQQGWTACASGLASAQWRKGGVMLGLAESSLAPGEYPRMTQYARVVSPC